MPLMIAEPCMEQVNHTAPLRAKPARWEAGAGAGRKMETAKADGRKRRGISHSAAADLSFPVAYGK